MYSAAQETYIVNNQNYKLIKENEGNLELLWNIIDGNYRYFIKKDGNILELKNKKGSSGKYNEDYKIILENLTIDKNLSAKKTNLTRISLKSFVDKYNLLKDPNYKIVSNAKLFTRLGFFGGITNNPFVYNLNNVINPLFGIEIEFSEAINIPRHSIYFQSKRTFSSESFDYSATHIIVGYRYRIFNKDAFTLYSNIDLAQYLFTTRNQVLLGNPNDFNQASIKSNGFEVPFTFGIGADIKLSRNSFLILSYNELFSILSTNNGNFSNSFALGCRFKI